jgi:hypothetical protein
MVGSNTKLSLSNTLFPVLSFTFDKFSKIQEEANANRIKVLELQQKLPS